ncbi:MAG: ArsR/SmtB family transcription factor [Caulobacteraceae bacterium]
MSAHLHRDPARVEAASERLREIASPHRLSILSLLLDGELAVGDIERGLGLRQPMLSQQLAALRRAGLVATRRVAKSVIYRLADEEARVFVQTLDVLLGTEKPQSMLSALPQAEPEHHLPSIGMVRRSRPGGGAAAFATTSHHHRLPALRGHLRQNT